MKKVAINKHYKNNFQVDSDDGPYAYKDDQWVGFDSIKSVKAKSQYILDNNFGGAMFWDTSTDDFNVGLFFLAILKILKSLMLMFITFENLISYYRINVVELAMTNTL